MEHVSSGIILQPDRETGEYGCWLDVIFSTRESGSQISLHRNDVFFNGKKSWAVLKKSIMLCRVTLQILIAGLFFELKFLDNCIFEIKLISSYLQFSNVC